VNFDLMLGIWLGVIVTLLVFVKVATWAAIRAAEIVAGWLFKHL